LALTPLEVALAAAVLVGITVTAYVVWPLLRREPPPAESSRRETFADALETEKHYVYASIVDLDTDLQSGKIEESEYRRLREGLIQEAARLLAQIDEVEAPEHGKGKEKA
jgi:hypothetical protein